MGRKKGRRNRSDNQGDDSENEHDDEIPVEVEGGDVATSNGGNSTNVPFKDMDFAQRRELQRQQAASKRRSKQKCYLCGKAGHVRRECPGIADDGRGMSRFKGKTSDRKHAKEQYSASRQSRSGSGASYDSSSENFVASLQYPEDFSNNAPYVDVHCDIPATLEYLRSGRGKTTVSAKEAIAEYSSAMKIARERSQLQAVISKTILTTLKPDRQPPLLWVNPVPLDLIEAHQVNLFFALGLSEEWKVEGTVDVKTATESLVTILHDNKQIIAVFASLDMSGDTIARSGMDAESQIRRFQCCLEAVGSTETPLQIHLSPGASSLVPHEQSVAGTDYAKTLLEFQSNLATAISKYPSLQVHIVGWAGQSKHMMALLQAFPQNIVAVGMDGAVTFSKAAHLHECAFEIPMDRLVLETSNIIPSNVANAMGRMAFSQSGWWPFLVESIVQHKKELVTIDQVVSAVYENSLKLYPQLGRGMTSSDSDHT